MTKEERKDFTKRLIWEIAKRKKITWDDAAVELILALGNGR